MAHPVNSLSQDAIDELMDPEFDVAPEDDEANWAPTKVISQMADYDYQAKKAREMLEPRLS